jgi:hypothetical protein
MTWDARRIEAAKAEQVVKVEGKEEAKVSLSLSVSPSLSLPPSVCLACSIPLCMYVSPWLARSLALSVVEYPREGCLWGKDYAIIVVGLCLPVERPVSPSRALTLSLLRALSLYVSIFRSQFMYAYLSLPVSLCTIKVLIHSPPPPGNARWW